MKNLIIILCVAGVLSVDARPRVRHIYRRATATTGATVGEPIRKPVYSLPPFPQRPNPPTPEEKARQEQIAAARGRLRAAQRDFLAFRNMVATNGLTAAQIDGITTRIQNILDNAE